MGEIPDQGQLIIVGSGGHALSVADAALSTGWTIVGFYSLEESGPASTLGPILSTLEERDLLRNALALGIGTNHTRESALDEITQSFPDARVVPVIHRTAWVSPYAAVQPGAVILAHATVGPGCTVGRGALINAGASLDHESSLGNFASLGPGASTGGSVSVGDRTMVGMQATILQGIRIGSDAVVGAHSLVNSDVESNIVAWGNPTRPMRSRLKDDSYY